MTGEHCAADTVRGLSGVNRPLLVRYDPDRAAAAPSKPQLLECQSGGFWRRREPLPVRDSLLLRPAGAATFAAYQQALEDSRDGRDETAFLFNCVAGLKYPMAPVVPPIDRHQPIDYSTV